MFEGSSLEIKNMFEGSSLEIKHIANDAVAKK